MGQTYRMSMDLDRKQVTLATRTPDASGAFARSWRDRRAVILLPDVLVERIESGSIQAPNVREVVEPDGTSYAALDFIAEVEVEETDSFAQMQAILGFDWGIRVLVTASVVDLSGHQLGHPFF
jgi:hypothetical protein